LDQYTDAYERSLSKADAWDTRADKIRNDNQSITIPELEEKIGPRPTVLQDPMDLLYPKPEIPDGGAPMPAATGESPPEPADDPQYPGALPKDVAQMQAEGYKWIPKEGGKQGEGYWYTQGEMELPPEQAITDQQADVTSARKEPQPSAGQAAADAQAAQQQPAPTQQAPAVPQQDQAKVKAEATSRLEQYGYTYENYTSAQSTLQRLKQQYPNIKSLDELPQKERRAAAHSLMIRNLAEAKK
jgi:hypothetical protein